MDNLKPAITALLDYSQADMDGVYVKTSRQAIHEVVDGVDKLRARIAELEAAQRWQPIETAPKAASGIGFMDLMWGPESDPHTGMGMRFLGRYFSASVFYTGGKQGTRQYSFRELEVDPTHFRLPLATPPD